MPLCGYSDYYLHKDTISNGRCVVPLRKEKDLTNQENIVTTQMSSQQVVNYENNYGVNLL